MKGIKNLEINEDELDITFLQELVKGDSRYKEIFSKIWQMAEEFEKKGKNLCDFVSWMRKMEHNLINRLYMHWEQLSGKPMTIQQEEAVFQNSKIQVSLTLIDKMIDLIDYVNKADEIAKLFGLRTFSPIMISKKTQGWSTGGKAKAKQDKKRLEERQERLRKLHQEMKERNENMSDHAIDLRIAKQEGLKRSTVYNLRKKIAEE